MVTCMFCREKKPEADFVVVAEDQVPVCCNKCAEEKIKKMSPQGL